MNLGASCFGLRVWFALNRHQSTINIDVDLTVHFTSSCLLRAFLCLESLANTTLIMPPFTWHHEVPDGRELFSTCEPQPRSLELTKQHCSPAITSRDDFVYLSRLETHRSASAMFTSAYIHLPSLSQSNSIYHAHSSAQNSF